MDSRLERHPNLAIQFHECLEVVQFGSHGLRQVRAGYPSASRKAGFSMGCLYSLSSLAIPCLISFVWQTTSPGTVTVTKLSLQFHFQSEEKRPTNSRSTVMKGIGATTICSFRLPLRRDRPQMITSPVGFSSKAS